jgi:hypothetical protein
MNNRKGKAIAAVIALATFGIGAAVGSAASSAPKTVTVTRPGVTTYVPGPTQTVQVPVTVSPPAPATGTVLGKWSGTGNQVTAPINLSATGDITVAWQYSGNTDSGMASNFIVTTTDINLESQGLPNDIAASGQGSTELFGGSPGQSVAFNVQATGSWTITVKSAG